MEKSGLLAAMAQNEKNSHITMTVGFFAFVIIIEADWTKV
jgi:hypothetical protein